MKSLRRLILFVAVILPGPLLVSQVVDASQGDRSGNPAKSQGLPAFEGPNSNTFYGIGAGNAALQVSDSSSLTYIGKSAGIATTSGLGNTYVGRETGLATTTASSNTFVGNNAGTANTTGGSNTCIGQTACYSNSLGANNTMLGNTAGSVNTGSQNTFLGSGAGQGSAAGSGGVFVGYQAGMNETTSNKLYIANSSDATPLIHGDFAANTLTVNGNLTAVGPDAGLVRLADNTTAATAKASRMVLLDHVNAANTPNYLFGAFNDATNHFVAFGGGAPVANAATQVDIFTAPAKGTAGGTARFTVLGNGFVGIGTQAPTHLVQLSGGAFSDGAAWSNASSRALKGNFGAIDPRAILDKVGALPVQSWTYNSEADSIRHLGPTAEDFFAAFGLGGDDKAIGTVDADGVALAAIQGVVSELREKDRALADAQTQIAAMAGLLEDQGRRLARLERLLVEAGDRE